MRRVRERREYFYAARVTELTRFRFREGAKVQFAHEVQRGFQNLIPTVLVMCQIKNTIFKHLDICRMGHKHSE
jgi:hypothetical protein